MDVLNANQRGRTSLEQLARGNRRQVVEHTLKLLARPSENPPGNTSSVADCAIEILEKIPGVSVKRYVSADHVHNLVAIVAGHSSGKRLIFNGHLDTFPMGNKAHWTRDPHGEEHGGRVYGLGVSDMKGGLAASMFALSNLAASKKHWTGEAVITFAGDEETMGVLGSKYLIDHVAEATGDAVICADVGSPSVLRVGEKGLLWLKISAKGRSAHAAHVHRGVSAINKLLDGLARIRALTAMKPSGREDVEAVVRAAAPISERFSGEGESEVLLNLTVTIGTISGGRLTNLIADQAEATADIRIPLGISTQDVLDAIGLAMADLPGIEIEIIQRYEPSWTDPAHPLIGSLKRAAREVMNIEPVVNMRVGASDARLHRLAGMPTIVCGLTPNNMGAADEFVDVEELMSLGEILTLAAFDFLSD